MAGPFFPWVGGKRALLPELLKRVPEFEGTYFEPFLGGGALFFELAGSGCLGKLPGSVVLGDANKWLINAYYMVQQCWADVAGLLRYYDTFHGEDLYYQTRSAFNSRGAGVDNLAQAARFIYLMRKGFNGVYRVNSSGRYNAPVGKSSRKACEPEMLASASACLQYGVELIAGNYERTVATAKEGDFVYFDPPYFPVKADSFAEYDKGSFSTHDQVRLAKVARQLKERGVKVLLSNSDSEATRAVYQNGWKLEQVMVARSVNSKAEGRGKVAELLIS